MGAEKSFLEHLGEARLARKYLEATTREPISPSISLLVAGASYYEDKKEAEAKAHREVPPVQYVTSLPPAPASSTTKHSSEYRAGAILHKIKQHLDEIPRYVKGIREEISGNEAALLPRDIRDSIETILRSAESVRSEIIGNTCSELESILKITLEMQDGFKEDRRFVRFLSDNSGFIVAQLKVTWGPQGFSDLNKFVEESDQLCEDVVGEANALLQETEKFRYELAAFRYKIQKTKELCRERQIREKIDTLPLPLRWGGRAVVWTIDIFRKS